VEKEGLTKGLKEDLKTSFRIPGIPIKKVIGRQLGPKSPPSTIRGTIYKLGKEASWWE